MASGRKWRALLAHVRTFVWVSLITVLIWVWADLERTGEASVSVTVKIEAPAGSDLRIVNPNLSNGRQVSFTVSGSYQAVEDFRQRTERETPTYEFYAQHAGYQTWNVLELLNSRLRPLGLTAQSANPAQLQFQVGRWVPVMAKVRFNATQAAVNVISINPAEVQVYVPEADAQPDMVIPTKAIDLGGVPAGVKQTKVVELASNIDDTPAELRGATSVTVTFEVQQPLDTVEIPITVELLAPPTVLEQIAQQGYVLQRRDEQEWTPKITVRGPSVQISRIRANPSLVHAYVIIHEADLKPQSWLAGPIHVVFPPDLRDLQVAQPESLTVNYKFATPSPTNLTPP